MALNPAADADAALKLHELSDIEIANRIRHSAHTEKALGQLLQRPTIQQADVDQLMAEAVHAGVLTPPEVDQLRRSLPKDPGQLRVVLNHLHQVSGHAGAALRAEQGSRLWGLPPGASRGAGR